MVPICDHFAQVSLTIFGFFLPQWLKLKTIAQELVQVSLTKRLFRFSNGSKFILIKPNLTAIAKSK